MFLLFTGLMVGNIKSDILRMNTERDRQTDRESERERQTERKTYIYIQLFIYI